MVMGGGGKGEEGGGSRRPAHQRPLHQNSSERCNRTAEGEP